MLALATVLTAGCSRDNSHWSADLAAPAPRARARATACPTSAASAVRAPPVIHCNGAVGAQQCTHFGCNQCVAGNGGMVCAM